MSRSDAFSALNDLQFQSFQFLLHLLEYEPGVEGGFLFGNVHIDGCEKKHQNLRQELNETLPLSSAEDGKEPFGHHHRRVVADDGEDIFDPFVDPFPNGGINGFVVKLDRCREWRKAEFPVAFVHPIRSVVVSDNIGCLFVHKRKCPYDDVRGDSGIKKRENIGDDRVVLPGGDDIPETQVEMVIVALGFFLISLRSLDSGERFGRLGSCCFRLLFGTTFRSTLITFEIIETIKSHRQ